MSKYTTELRYICENYAGLEESVGYDKIDEVIEKSRPKIFDFSYPIFDEEYRPVLEKKILLHYYTREIGSETVGLWKFRLMTTLNEIMPYYNKMYKTELIEFNPLYSEDITTEGKRDGNSRRDDKSVINGNERRTGSDVTQLGGKDTDTTDSKHSEWDLYSDTPQGGIQGILDAELTPQVPSVGNQGYLTSARHTFGDTDGSTSEREYGRSDTTTYNSGVNRNVTNTLGGTVRNIDEYIEHVYGYRGRNPSKSIMEFRKTFLNIDMMIIEELNDLFMLLWGVI